MKQILVLTLKYFTACAFIFGIGWFLVKDLTSTLMMILLMVLSGILAYMARTLQNNTNLTRKLTGMMILLCGLLVWPLGIVPHIQASGSTVNLIITVITVMLYGIGPAILGSRIGVNHHPIF